MAASVIRHFRLSILQTLTILELVQDTRATSASRLRDIALKSGYQTLWRNLQRSHFDDELGISLPWNVPPEEQPFWSWYLKRQPAC